MYEDKPLQEMKRLCEAGLSLTEIEKNLGVAIHIIRYHLKKMGIKTVGGELWQKHSLNHNAFDVLTPEALYWLGFLMADGCVHLNRNTISLVLKAGDIKHLEKYKKFLGYSGPIRNIQYDYTTELCVLAFSSAHMKQKLISYGIVPHKGKQSDPIYVSKELAVSVDFWRGMIDGDGGVYIVKNCYVIGLYGNSGILEQFRAYVKQFVETKATVRLQKRNSYQFTLSSKKAFLIIKLLYEGAEVFLDRKNIRALEVIGATI